jgi:Na+/phosphate symporter
MSKSELNQLLKGYNILEITSDQDEFTENDLKRVIHIIRTLLEEQSIHKTLVQNAEHNKRIVKNRIEMKLKTIEMFFNFIRESLTTPVNTTFTHRDRDAINQLVVSKITQFVDVNECCKLHFYSDEF